MQVVDSTQEDGFQLLVFNRYDPSCREYLVKFDSKSQKEEFVISEHKATAVEYENYCTAFSPAERATTGQKLYEARVRHVKAWNAKQAANQLTNQSKELA